MPQPCTVHVIQVVLVASCQCRGPPATTWKCPSRVSPGRRCTKGWVCGRQPGTGIRRSGGGAVTPFIHLEVPDSLFVSPGLGVDIRQSMGWTKVCGTARSGVWVLKGNAIARIQPANLDRLRVQWTQRGYETTWVTPGHDCLCSHAYGRRAAVRPQTKDSIWDGAVSLWRSHLSCLLSVQEGRC